MKEYNHKEGVVGETLAQKYLKKMGYKIIECNYSNLIGEIDIIAKQKEYFVFIEVKARGTYAFGRPCEAVTPYKQNKIRKVAQIYIKQHRIFNAPCRFDVIEVLGEKINHIENAF